LKTRKNDKTTAGEEKEELSDAAIDDEMKEERIEKNIGFAYEACYSTDADGGQVGDV